MLDGRVLLAADFPVMAQSVRAVTGLRALPWSAGAASSVLSGGPLGVLPRTLLAMVVFGVRLAGVWLNQACCGGTVVARRGPCAHFWASAYATSCFCVGARGEICAWYTYRLVGCVVQYGSV